FSTDIHPGWVARMSQVITCTKVIRRVAWEFVEGMPMESLYGEVSREDQFLQTKLVHFFGMVLVPDVTVKYWNYPDSFLDRQLSKFGRAPALYPPSRDDPRGWRALDSKREESEKLFLAYLEKKLDLMGWREKLQDYPVRVPPPAGIAVPERPRPTP